MGRVIPFPAPPAANMNGIRSMTRQEADMLVARASVAAPHMVPLLRDMAAGSLTLAAIARGSQSVSPKAWQRAGKPVVAILADDDHGSTGPAGFPVARKLLRWARGLVVHAAAGHAWQYQMAADLALAVGSCVIVETSTSCADEWLAFAQQAAYPRRHISFGFRPEAGPHPVLPPREAQH